MGEKGHPRFHRSAFDDADLPFRKVPVDRERSSFSLWEKARMRAEESALRNSRAGRKMNRRLLSLVLGATTLLTAAGFVEGDLATLERFGERNHFKERGVPSPFGRRLG
jgi:hypothetical protein